MIKNARKLMPLLVLIVFAITGCDPITKSLIHNKTNHNIKIILQLDKELILNSYQVPDYNHLLMHAVNSDSIRIISIDTIHLVGIYDLPPLCSCQVDFGIGKKPRFEFDRLIIISSDDTLKYVDKHEIEQAFKNTNGFNFELTIK